MGLYNCTNITICRWICETVPPSIRNHRVGEQASRCKLILKHWADLFPRTSVHVDQSMFPIVRNISSQNRSRSPSKKLKTSLSVSSVTEEVLAARADPTVNFDLRSKKLTDISQTKSPRNLGHTPLPLSIRQNRPSSPLSVSHKTAAM